MTNETRPKTGPKENEPITIHTKFYAFLIVPLNMLGGFVGMFIAYPFILLAFFAPIGPISIAVHLLLSCMYLIYGLLFPGFPLNFIKVYPKVYFSTAWVYLRVYLMMKS